MTKDLTVTQNKKNRAWRRMRLPARLVVVSWRDLAVIMLPALLLIAVVVWISFRFVRPAPLDTIVIASGPEGSPFRTTAEKYRKIIERSGVKVKILASQGGLDNLQKLANPAINVDVGFVQGGFTDGVEIESLNSLGSVFTQPLIIFFRSNQRIDQLSQFRRKRLAIGPAGTATHSLAMQQ